METLRLTVLNPLFPPYSKQADDNLTVEKLEETIRLCGERMQSEYIIIKLTYPEMQVAKLSPKLGKILFKSVAITEQAEELHREFHEQKEQSNA